MLKILLFFFIEKAMHFVNGNILIYIIYFIILNNIVNGKLIILNIYIESY